MSPSTVYTVDGAVTVASFFQDPYRFSLRSTEYCLTGRPPSFSGGCHCKVAVEQVMSLASSDLGGDGGSTNTKWSIN